MNKKQYITLTNCNVGSRRRRNPQEAVDINLYDVMKFFDKMWLLEYINTLFEVCLRNDKLVLLYETNKPAQIAIKTSSATTNFT